MWRYLIGSMEISGMEYNHAQEDNTRRGIDLLVG